MTAAAYGRVRADGVTTDGAVSFDTAAFADWEESVRTLVRADLSAAAIAMTDGRP